MASGQARMIQMLSQLSQIQTTKRAQALDEQKFEESKGEFAQQMGFNAKSQQYKQVGDLLDAIAKSSTESRSALISLGKSIGLPDEQVQALAAFGQSAPESLQIMQQRAAAQGIANQTPGQAAANQGEAATIAQTGMNQGQVATSGLTANMAQGGQAPIAGMSQDAVTQAAQAFIQRMVSGQSGLDYAASQAGAANPKMVQSAAGIAAGTGMSAAQQAGAAAQMVQGQAALGGVQADFYRTNASILASSADVAAKLATAKALGGLTPENIISATTEARNLIGAIGKASGANADALLSRYNQIVGMIDPSMRASSIDQLPGKSTLLDNLEKTLRPTQVPSTGAPMFQNSLAPQGGYMQTPPAALLQTNPMSAFVRPPQ